MTDPAPRVLRLPEVEQRTGLRRSTIYRKAKAGEFPKQFRISGRAAGWLESEVTDYIREKIEARAVG